METFVIEGGRQLGGTVKPGGNKNAALPLLAACLLTDEQVVLHNVPRIRDVETMVALLGELGAEVSWTGANSVSVKAEKLQEPELNSELCRRIRASILLAGPLLARLGRVRLSPPGGDVIGRRRLDTHFQVLQGLGADFDFDGQFQLKTKGLQGGEIILDEPSVTASENAIMAAALAKGETVLHNVATEPHVCELARFLNSAGASIEGIGSNTLRIIGQEKLQGFEHRVGPDYIEVGSFIGLAAVTGSEIEIEGVRADDLRMIKLIYERLGVRFDIRQGSVIVPAEQDLLVQLDAQNAVPKIDDGPWPAFPSDMMSIALVVATQCQGTVLFFEKMFESRLFFVDRLISMGARIILCDPHRAVVVGASPLLAATIESPDIRAGMALLLAGLSAQGTTRIGNIGQIDRGYEQMEKKLQALGAAIMRAPA